MAAFPKKSQYVIAGAISALAISAGPVATATAAGSTGGGPTVRVAAGETLGAIAARFHTTVSQLAAANSIRNPNDVVAGRVLQLSGAGATPVAQSPVTVRIAAGETLSAIATRFHTTVAQLAAANGMRNPNLVVAGQVLRLSGAGVAGAAPQQSAVTVTVAPGDTLAMIAARVHTSVAQLATANGLRNPNFIYAGQVLHLSDAGWAAAVGSLPATLLAHPGRLVLRYHFIQAATAYRVPPRLLEALCWWESGWQQGAASRTGAIGVCQMEPQTATYVNSSLVRGRPLNVHSAADNITMAAALLHQLFHEANGNARLAIGGYYQGFPSVARNGMLPETRAYVRGIEAYASIFPPGG
jgi:LysM repeat protein